MATTVFLDPDMLVPMYKLEYDLGWVTKADIYNYATWGYFTKKGYKAITGEDYESYQAQA